MLYDVLYSEPLRVEQVSDDVWTLLQDMTVWVTPGIRTYDGVTIDSVTVEAGFETDFASVPRLPLAYLLAGGVGDRAAVVHDWFCVNKVTDYKTAADVFEACLKHDKVSWFKRKLMWSAVVCFGPRF